VNVGGRELRPESLVWLLKGLKDMVDQREACQWPRVMDPEMSLEISISTVNKRH
jgi:hypothetical protein